MVFLRCQLDVRNYSDLAHSLVEEYTLMLSLFLPWFRLISTHFCAERKSPQKYRILKNKIEMF